MNRGKLQDALVQNRSVALFLVAAAVLVLVSDGFATVPNLRNLATAVSIEGIMVVGMALVMIGGGFDLSIGSVMALAGVLVMDLQPYGIGPAVAAALAASLAIGAINGGLVAIVRINPFIATLATMITVRGFVMAYTDAQPVVGMQFEFISLGRGNLLGIPYPTVVFAAALVVGFCALTFFPFGRHVYAVGGDEVGARQAGINVPATKMATYMASGLCAGIAGVILAARLNTGSPIIGDNTALSVIAAVLLGGISLSGGIGTVLGAFGGLMSIGLLGNAMNLYDVPAYYQRITLGGLLVSLVVLDTWWSRRARPVGTAREH